MDPICREKNKVLPLSGSTLDPVACEELPLKSSEKAQGSSFGVSLPQVGIARFLSPLFFTLLANPLNDDLNAEVLLNQLRNKRSSSGFQVGTNKWNFHKTLKENMQRAWLPSWEPVIGKNLWNRYIDGMAVRLVGIFGTDTLKTETSHLEMARTLYKELVWLREQGVSSLSSFCAQLPRHSPQLLLASHSKRPKPTLVNPNHTRIKDIEARLSKIPVGQRRREIMDTIFRIMRNNKSWKAQYFDPLKKKEIESRLIRLWDPTYPTSQTQWRLLSRRSTFSLVRFVPPNLLQEEGVVRDIGQRFLSEIIFLNVSGLKTNTGLIGLGLYRFSPQELILLSRQYGASLVKLALTKTDVRLFLKEASERIALARTSVVKVLEEVSVSPHGDARRLVRPYTLWHNYTDLERVVVDRAKMYRDYLLRGRVGSQNPNLRGISAAFRPLPIRAITVWNPGEAIDNSTLGTILNSLVISSSSTNENKINAEALGWLQQALQHSRVGQALEQLMARTLPNEAQVWEGQLLRIAEGLRSPADAVEVVRQLEQAYQIREMGESPVFIQAREFVEDPGLKAGQAGWQGYSTLGYSSTFQNLDQMALIIDAPLFETPQEFEHWLVQNKKKVDAFSPKARVTFSEVYQALEAEHVRGHPKFELARYSAESYQIVAAGLELARTEQSGRVYFIEGTPDLRKIVEHYKKRYGTQLRSEIIPVSWIIEGPRALYSVAHDLKPKLIEGAQSIWKNRRMIREGTGVGLTSMATFLTVSEAGTAILPVPQTSLQAQLNGYAIVSGATLAEHGVFRGMQAFLGGVRAPVSPLFVNAAGWAGHWFAGLGVAHIVATPFSMTAETLGGSPKTAATAGLAGFVGFMTALRYGLQAVYPEAASIAFRIPSPALLLGALVSFANLAAASASSFYGEESNEVYLLAMDLFKEEASLGGLRMVLLGPVIELGMRQGDYKEYVDRAKELIDLGKSDR